MKSKIKPKRTLQQSEVKSGFSTGIVSNIIGGNAVRLWAGRYLFLEVAVEEKQYCLHSAGNGKFVL